MSRLWFSTIASDVSTNYTTAFVDTRNPNPPSAAATLVTNTEASGDNIEMTITAGGTVRNFITKPFASDVSLDSALFCNVWVKESNASANAGFGIRLAEYTSSEQAAFHDQDGTVEGTTSDVQQRFVTSAISATTIDDGNRLVLDARVIPIGTMGASQTFTFTYDGASNDTLGDSYLGVAELIEVDESQYGGGTFPNKPGMSQGYYKDLLRMLNEAVASEIISEESSVRAAIDEIGFEQAKL